MPTIEKTANHLLTEKSPYLIQHAYNPVDWYPWSEEAFAKATAEDKPIFMSIGYSTCHWCHVMAHESFEDDEVAQVLNREFVAVKVDREERPDVDAVYMEVCQALTGSGGWPMTIIMTPDKKPFFAGTYLPKNSRYGRTGLIDLLYSVSQRWATSRKALLENSEEITSYIQEREAAVFGEGAPANELVFATKESLARSFDQKWGGFGSSPKFPMPHNLIFLLRFSALEHDEGSMKIAESTLEHMYRGGIFDHIGGGFSRYSTDDKWLIPHFEKMLYDNALLIWAYTKAFTLTGRLLYKNIADKTIKYVLSELSEPMGGFMCGQDADSEGVEGKYYVFTESEVKSVLGETDGDVFCRRFGIEEHGYFEGKSIPNLIACEAYEEDNQKISELSRTLYEYRLHRTSLHKDDKVLTSWNAMMIIALARAGRVYKNAEYLEAALKAEKFVSDNLMDSNGRLKIRWKDGEAAKDGQLDDYAYFGLALLELYGATFNVSYLTKAAQISEIMSELFCDEQNGGYFMYAKDAEQLITRPKPIYDGAIPSGNSAAAMFLNKLAKLTAEEKFIKAAEKQLEFVSAAASAHPASHSLSLLALMEAEYSCAELICVSAGNEVPLELTELISKKTFGNLSILLKTTENAEELKAVAPFTTEYQIPESGALYYLCRGRTCRKPVDKLEELENELSELF